MRQCGAGFGKRAVVERWERNALEELEDED
jgi:hypothetical protein